MNTMTDLPQKRKISWIESLRGLACLCVVVEHYLMWSSKTLQLTKHFFRILLAFDIPRLSGVQVDLKGQAFAQQSWCIMTPPHTLLLAELMAENLKRHGCAVRIEIHHSAEANNSRFDKNVWYVVMCPRFFKPLPPAHRRIAYQLEQSVSSRWFSELYIQRLKTSLAILEYSSVNIEFLKKKEIGYPRVHYLPIGASSAFFAEAPIQKKYDLLFYGDSNSPRRLKMLSALQQHFKVYVANEVFGEEMHQLIRESKVVVNLHYYENGLLEMPRIQECLSLGTPVVSEGSQDQEDYPEIKGAVRFFAIDSIEGMLAAVEDALENPIPPEKVQEAVRLGANRFAFMFDHFLVRLGFLPISALENKTLVI